VAPLPRVYKPTLLPLPRVGRRAHAEMPTGTIKRWLGDKGFGFIAPDDQSHDIFAHIRQKAGEPSEPVQEGRRVVYEAEYDPQKGKPKASQWYFADGAAPVAAATAVLQQQQQQQQQFQQQQHQQQQQLTAVAPPPQANPAVAQLAANNGVGYQALVQAATTAISAIAANPQGNNAALLANLANLAQQPGAPTTVAATGQPGATVVAPPPAATPPLPPAPQHALEEVQVPAQFMQQVIGTGGSGLEEIKKKAGGDIVIELGHDAGGMRTLKVKGPPISASLGACLIMQQVAEECVMAN